MHQNNYFILNFLHYTETLDELFIFVYFYMQGEDTKIMP